MWIRTFLSQLDPDVGCCIIVCKGSVLLYAKNPQIFVYLKEVMEQLQQDLSDSMPRAGWVVTYYKNRQKVCLVHYN